MLTIAKSMARRAGVTRPRVAAARMLVERHTLATTKRPVTRQRGRILCYHSIDEAVHGVNDVSRDQLRRHVELALERGYRFVPAAQISETGGAPHDLAITFDDGWISAATDAAEILAEYSIPWTLFVVTSWCDHKTEWSRARVASWNDIERLAASGIEIGSHSCTHPDFGRIELPQMIDELAQSRAAIERRLGGAPRSFAIPLGQSANWTAAASDAARQCGYEIIYAQAEDTRPPGTVSRSFVTRFDHKRTFLALLAGAFDSWEEWV